MGSRQKEIYLLYRGPVGYDTIGHLISELKIKMHESQVRQSVYKKVLMVMIEALENIYKYHEYFEREKDIFIRYLPELSIVRYSVFFLVKSSNLIRKNDVHVLQERLKNINKMDRTGIKDAYKRIITNGIFSEKGGAGLGLIEMAKISDDKIDFSFVPVNDEFFLFSLSLKINCS